MATFHGDPTKNESYLAYGEPILSVADSTVVQVVSDQTDAPPHETLPGLRLDELGGNYVIVDIGGGVYAFYAHLKPGSVAVKVGDKLKRGQVIARARQLRQHVRSPPALPADARSGSPLVGQRAVRDRPLRHGRQRRHRRRRRRAAVAGLARTSSRSSTASRATRRHHPPERQHLGPRLPPSWSGFSRVVEPYPCGGG